MVFNLVFFFFMYFLQMSSMERIAKDVECKFTAVYLQYYKKQICNWTN